MAPRKPRGGRREFPRRTKPRTTKRAILIVCEGAVTEPEYFGFFKKELEQWLDIRIARKSAGKRSPRDVLEKAKNEVCLRMTQPRKANFDSVWCVLDREIDEDGTLQEVIKQLDGINKQSITENEENIQETQYNLILSNPNFEYWLLLHFENTSRPLTPSRQAMQELHKHLPNFSKNLTDEMMEDIFPLTSTAIKNAKERFRNHSIAELVETNPSTHVYKLVEELQSQSPDNK